MNIGCYFNAYMTFPLFIVCGDLNLKLQCYINGVFYASIVTLLCWMLMQSTNGSKWIVSDRLFSYGTYSVGLGKYSMCFSITDVFFSLAFHNFTIWLFSKQGGTNMHYNLGLTFAVCSIFTLGSGFICATCIIPFVFNNKTKRVIHLLIITALGLYLRFGFNRWLWHQLSSSICNTCTELSDVFFAFCKAL